MPCKRCGNEETDDAAPTLHKCPKCENIRFKRELLVPLNKEIKRNFQRIRRSRYNLFITGLYQFGSFSEGKPECGDIDFLITHDEVKLKKFLDMEVWLFHLQNDLALTDDDHELLFGSNLINGSWDYRTCEEYPDCLGCRYSGRCNLPDEDYHSLLHTYCTTKCKKRNKDPLPDCIFSDCEYLHDQIKDRILKDIHDILTDGEIEFIQYTPDMRVRVIDIIIKTSVDELRQEFDSMEIKKGLNLIRIY